MKQFDSVPIKIPAKNVFDLSHDVKATYNFANLYPFLCHPVYPGDVFNCRAEVFLRTMPLLSPLMHNVDMRLYFFFVPNRIIFNENRKKDWKTFITGGEDGMAEVTLPYFTYGDFVDKSLMKNGSLLDHMGFPSADLGDHAIADGVKDLRICSLPFRAYQCIYNEYFRNQNVQNEIEFSYDEGHEKLDGIDGIANIQRLFTMRKKCWEKDYFTSCLPFAQRGEAVRLPIDFANVTNNDSTITGQSLSVSVDTAKKKGASITTTPLQAHTSGGSQMFVKIDDNSTTFVNDDNIELLGNATGSISVYEGDLTFTGFAVGTINDFRYCLRLQQWLENNARCGSRYIEQLLAHFGVVSSDARLQRPELLGGGKVPILFSDIPQQSYGDGKTAGQEDDVTGNLVGKGTLYGKTSGFKKYFEEHGILMGILTIIPRTSYSQGIPRVWTAFDKTDWYFPEFANLGEQAVLKKELFVQLDKTLETGSETPDAPFGYQGRFTELRYIPSSVHGEMRSDLQFWHLGRLFDSQPALNSDFVTADPRVNVFAMEDIVNSGYDPFVCQIHLDIKAVRPLPKYAVPTF